MTKELTTDEKIEKLNYLSKLAKEKENSKDIIEKIGIVTVYSSMVDFTLVQAARLVEQIVLKDKLAEGKEYPGFEGKQMSYGVKNITQVPTYEIKVPDEKHLQALKIIKENGGKLTKKHMAELAVTQGIIQVNAEKDNYSQARFASLDKNIIQPLLERWKFIEVEKIGRTRWIKLNQDGINAAEFLI